MKALVIHGHFYQPPRENPWTGLVDREPSAHPFDNWNERIHFECYRPNAWARILDGMGRTERIVNNYALLSFNLGPTLLSWLQTYAPDTYARVLEADRQSLAAHKGHGNAFAQGYNHLILPLCNERDRRTQVRWGIADFQHRFGRDPESLWLPETACNHATLDVLIEEGLTYVVLSPYQADRIRPIGGKDWQSVADGSIDPGTPYRYAHRDGSGRTIAIFFYDGPGSRSIAFEGALASSQALVDRLDALHPGKDRLLHLATDGESYGHHTKFGDRTVAYALAGEAPARGFRVMNYGEYLSEHPPTYEVELQAGSEGKGTSWSCAHGVGRWFRHCGCHTGGREGWTQEWRGPLREALDLLRDEGIRLFESRGAAFFRDPWAARDAYIELILERGADRDAWFANQAARPLTATEQVEALTLMAMQRQAMLMYTSCGWFFNDLAGIETVQILKYAARVLDYMCELGHEPPLERFLERLDKARSNVKEMGTGADLFRHQVEPCRVTPKSVAAHLAITGLVGEPPLRGEVAGYRYHCQHVQTQQHGRISLSTLQILLESIETGAIHDFAAAAAHHVGVAFYCVLRPFPGPEAFEAAADRLWERFPTASLPVLLRIAQAEFGPDEYGLEHVLAEGKKQIAESVFGEIVSRFDEHYDHLYKDNKLMIEQLQEYGFELPGELKAAAEFALGRRFEQEVRRQHESPDSADYREAIAIAEEVARHGYQIDRTASRRLFQTMIERGTGEALAAPTETNVDEVSAILSLSRKLGIVLNLDCSQEMVYAALQASTNPPAGLMRLAEAMHLALSLIYPNPAAPMMGTAAKP